MDSVIIMMAVAVFSAMWIGLAKILGEKAYQKNIGYVYVFDGVVGFYLSFKTGNLSAFVFSLFIIGVGLFVRFDSDLKQSLN